jgi:hypothetical protein
MKTAVVVAASFSVVVILGAVGLLGEAELRRWRRLRNGRVQDRSGWFV